MVKLVRKNKFPSLFTNQAYDVYIETFDQTDQEKSIDWLPCLNVSKLGYKLLFAFFDLIRSESLHHNYSETLHDEFGNILGKLFKNFNLDNLDDRGSLEDSIEEYIRKLEEYHFFLPKKLVDLLESKGYLVPLESGIGYKGDLDLVIECIREILKS